VAGERCRNLEELCDNGAKLARVGSFGWAGFAFICIGQILLVAFGSVGKKQHKFKMLIASLANFCIGWTCLLCSWAMFASAMGDKATCTVMDASKTGAVKASGNFGDIIVYSGSYSYYFVIFSWILTTLVIGVVAQKVFVDVRKGGGKTVATE